MSYEQGYDMAEMKEMRPQLRQQFDDALKRLEEETAKLRNRLEPMLTPDGPDRAITEVRATSGSPFSAQIVYLNELIDRVQDLNRRFEY